MTELLLGYALISVLFLIPTFLEGEGKALPWNWRRISGLMLCLAWPALILYALAIRFFAKPDG
jgi:hypothetical protein